jgi:hypothetical protein
MVSTTARLALAVALVGSSAVAASAATLDTGFGTRPSDIKGYIMHNGRQIAVGSAAGRVRAIRHVLPQNIFINPKHAFYVADPSMNAIVLFSKNGTGNQFPEAVLSGPSTQLDGPIAVTSGYDQPCTANATPSAANCTNYIWVANQLNDTITVYGGSSVGQYPLHSPIQVPSYVYYTSSSCTPQFTAPTGISHIDPVFPNTSGYVVVTDSAANDLQIYPPAGFGVVCPDSSYTDGRFALPAGVSIDGALPNLTFLNANAAPGTVIGTQYFDNGFGTGTYAPLPVGTIWGPGPGAQVVGTTIDTTKPQGGYIWASSDANVPVPFDALWVCTDHEFVHAIANTCPLAPAITTGLSTPGLLRIAGYNHLIYVPNEGNGTVTSYKQAVSASPVATYVNLGTPTGVGVEGQF